MGSRKNARAVLVRAFFIINFKNMKIFQIVTTIIGITMSLGYYPQAYKIWKLKSAKEISLVNYIILGIGTLTWFIYGLVLNDVVIMISFIFGVVGSWLMIFLVLKYRNPSSNIVHFVAHRFHSINKPQKACRALISFSALVHGSSGLELVIFSLH